MKMLIIPAYVILSISKDDACKALRHCSWYLDITKFSVALLLLMLLFIKAFSSFDFLCIIRSIILYYSGPSFHN